MSVDVELHRGDSRLVLAGFEASSFDVVICDPPFGLNSGLDAEGLLRSWVSGRRLEGADRGIAGASWDGQVPGPATWRAVGRVLKPGAWCCVFASPRTVDLTMVALRLGGFAIVDQVAWLHANAWPRARRLDTGPDGADPAGDWSGWATALKSSNEPIVIAQWPRSGTVAENIGQYGTGLFNVDGAGTGRRMAANVVLSHHPDCTDDQCQVTCAVASLDEQSGRLKARGNRRPTRSGGSLPGTLGPTSPVLADHGPGDAGGASRFFYAARASRAERDAGLTEGKVNPHVAAKPLDLLRWLIRLTTPPDGLVLDPFVGSGSTVVAAALEGHPSVGIDLDEQYLEVASARVTAAGGAPVIRRPARRTVEGDEAAEVRGDLRTAARRVRSVEARAAASRVERDQLIARGRAAGLTWRELATLAGVSSPQAAERIGRRIDPDATR